MTNPLQAPPRESNLVNAVKNLSMRELHAWLDAIWRFVTGYLDQSVKTDASPTFAGATFGNSGLHILDTDASHDLIITPGSNLSADRVLTVTTGDAARTITLSGNPTLADWFNQSVKTTATPTFAGVEVGTDGIVIDGGIIDSSDDDLEIDCGTDKTIVLTESVWDDMRVVPGSFDRPGVTDPSIVAYNVNGGGVSTYLWQFQKNAIASFTVQLPHGYKHGTDILVHIHWTPGPNGATENGKTVGWKLQYAWANINGTFPTMLTADMSDACDGTDHKHQMTPEATIDGHTVAKNISSMLICNVRRTDTGTDDTWSGTASGSLPMLLEIDFHFEIDTIGSRQSGTK